PACGQLAGAQRVRRVTVRASKRYPRHNGHMRGGVTLIATTVVFATQVSAVSALPDGGQSPQPVAPGFHMEGQPQLEIPFGDADAYRKTVDRFLALHDQMQELRDDFSRSVQDVLARVAVPEAGDKKRHCPEAEIAAPYARAFQLGQQYLRSGHELERAFGQVRDLDGLGETQGLTPDYRYKVKRVLELYKQLLADYREM